MVGGLGMRNGEEEELAECLEWGLRGEGGLTQWEESLVESRL